MKCLGLIGGLSWESTAEYYRLLNQGVRERLGALHSARLLLWSFDFQEIERLQRRDDWSGAERSMVAAARALQAGGAEILLICSNTMHRVAEAVSTAVPLPLVHIADATARAVAQRGLQRPLLLGTRYTMEQDFYTGRLRERFGIDVRVPSAADRERVNRIIYEELCRGVIDARSRRHYLDIIAASGADGVILGCTEIGLLVSPGDTDLPLIDSTRAHVGAALELALG